MSDHRLGLFVYRDTETGTSELFQVFQLQNFKMEKPCKVNKLDHASHKNLNLNKVCGVKFGLKLTAYFCVHSEKLYPIRSNVKDFSSYICP